MDRERAAAAVRCPAPFPDRLGAPPVGRCPGVGAPLRPGGSVPRGPEGPGGQLTAGQGIGAGLLWHCRSSAVPLRPSGGLSVLKLWCVGYKFKGSLPLP